MIKSEELTNPESCMSRALPDERVFVLLCRDESAPLAIRGWIMARISRGKNKMTDPQIVEALECAELMDIERPFVRFELAGAYLKGPDTVGISPGFTCGTCVGECRCCNSPGSPR